MNFKITDPQKFQLASEVVKNSTSGIFSNKRLLVIKKGHLYYYSNIPKSFKGDPKILQSVHQLPKCSIQILNIKQIKGYQPSSSYFSIQFQAKHMMERQDIRKTLTLQQYNFAPKSSKQIVTWQFTCQNKQIKQYWVNALQTLQAYYAKEKINIQKFFDNINKKQDQVSSTNSKNPRASYFPWKQDQPKKMQNDIFKKKSQQIAIQYINIANSQNNSPINQSSLQNSQINSLSSDYKNQKSTSSIHQISPPKPYQFQSIIKLQPTKIQQPKLTAVQQLGQLSKQKIINQPPIEKDKQQEQIKSEEIFKPIQHQVIIEDVENEGITTPIPTFHQDQINKQNNLQQKKSSIPELSLQHNFYTIQRQIFKGDFQYRINKQKQLIQLMNTFKINAISYFIQIVQEKKINSKQSIYLQNGIIYKIGLVHTQNFQINNQQKIFYNQDKIKLIKQQFKIYNNLFTQILQNLKTNQSAQFNLRVPLSFFFQYKGICALAIEQNQQYAQLSNNDIKHEKSHLQKIGYDPYNFSFRFNEKTGLCIVYVKKAKRTEQKHHNVSFQPPIDHNFVLKARKQKASTSLVSLEKYMQGLQRIKQFNGICSKQQILKALQICIFCKKLRKIYRSAQGQLDENSFFNLIINKDPTMISILQKSGCENIPKFNGQVIDFLEHYFGLTFQTDFSQKSRKKDKVLATYNFPLIRQYNVQNIEINESLNKFSKYIQTNQIQLASKTLKLKQQIFDLTQNIKKYQTEELLDVLYKRAQISYAQNDFLQSINICKMYLSKCDDKKCFSINTLKKLPIYLLMMKAYANFSQVQLSKALNETNQLITYNFGSSNSIFINIWSLASHLYSQNFNNQLIAQKLMTASLQLSNKIFGQRSKQKGQILLDLSRIYKQKNIQKSKFYLKQSKQLLKLYGTQLDLVIVEIFSCGLFLFQGNKAECQKCLTSLTQFIQTIKNKGVNRSNVRELYNMKYQLSQFLKKENLCKQTIQQLWDLDLYSRQLALQMGYKLAIKKMEDQNLESSKVLSQHNELIRRQLINSSQNLLKGSYSLNSSNNFTKQQALVNLDQKKKQYGNQSITDMILDCIQSKDSDFIQCLICSLGRQKISILIQNRNS